MCMLIGDQKCLKIDWDPLLKNRRMTGEWLSTGVPKKSWGFEESPEEWIEFRSVGAWRSNIKGMQGTVQPREMWCTDKPMWSVWKVRKWVCVSIDKADRNRNSLSNGELLEFLIALCPVSFRHETLTFNFPALIGNKLFCLESPFHCLLIISKCLLSFS